VIYFGASGKDAGVGVHEQDDRSILPTLKKQLVKDVERSRWQCIDVSQFSRQLAFHGRTISHQALGEQFADPILVSLPPSVKQSLNLLVFSACRSRSPEFE